MTTATRRRLASIWHAQAATEARVARSFALVAESLAELGAPAALTSLAERAVDDEHRHAALCEDAAGRYLGASVPPHRELPHQYPAHTAAESGALRKTLWVLGQCAFNETFASAYLGAAHRGARSPFARAVLRELLEDEVDHARLGWAYVSVLPETIRRGVERWLVPLTVSNLREWRGLNLPEEDILAAHGVPAREVAVTAVEDAVLGLIVPGFDAMGLDTQALRRAIESGELRARSNPSTR
ncbi:MAG: hypothetical protein AB8I08_10535 [Sandaracinaceae bacterium]